MDRRRFALSAVGIAVLSGCGGGGSGGGGGFAFPPVGGSPAPAPGEPSAPLPPAPQPPVPPAPNPPAPPAGPELATPTLLPASTILTQSIETEDRTLNAAVGPGQANFWDLRPDFCIGDGWKSQFAGALALGVRVGRSSAGFDGDQKFKELTPLGPEMTAADGLKIVSITDNPQFQSNGFAAFLHAVPDARLQQTLDLRQAVAPVNVQWTGKWGALRGNFVGSGDDVIDPPEPAFMQVVLRDTSGKELRTLFKVDSTGNSNTWGQPADLTDFAGQVVVLSFEQCNCGQGTSIEMVSVDDSAPRSRSFIVNGDFSAGLSGWTVSPTRGVQNIRSATRTLNKLEVQRTFYAQPNQSWGRMTDTFHNPTASSITAKVTYVSFLGSDGAGVIYPPASAPQKAVSVWDGYGLGRDAGIVFGTADGVDYSSASMLNSRDGRNTVTVDFNITVPAGGTVTLANFLILTGTNTWFGATSIAARATDVDTQAAAIAANFRTDVLYQRGLTQLQLDTLKNF
ncbi:MULTISPECIES: hypothetical protein [Variovorax]|uniref:hypothetical protein n=1 Tax=Variovorax TaxID=34072 RepID=UPI000AAA5361|nr:MULTISPECIES: hypothetical protein [Variovorax]MBN8752574.1 hypothetical protein [Variovorax sp.]UKI06809.1 hypothetical protein L3V85_28975 [Variovorax paradoxus]